MSNQQSLMWDLSLGKWSGMDYRRRKHRADVSGHKYSKGRGREEQRLRTEICPDLFARGSELAINEVEKGEHGKGKQRWKTREVSRRGNQREMLSKGREYSW